MVIDRRSEDSGALRSVSLLRDPVAIMRPERLAAMQPSRISASRFIISRAAKGRWAITCKRFKLDALARGTAVYEIDAGGWIISFVVHSFEPKNEGRTGRIIGTAWDMMGSLIDGPVTEHDVDLVGQEMPLLYHGRAAPRTLIWCRSNRSGRIFDTTIAALAEGRQPEVGPLNEAGYVMRNTGLDGNGSALGLMFYVNNHPMLIDRWLRARERAIAHDLGSAGVAIVAGAHAHRASRRIELLGGLDAVVVHGLGNFVFDQRAPRASGAVLQISQFEQGTRALRLVPLPDVFTLGRGAAAAR